MKQNLKMFIAATLIAQIAVMPAYGAGQLDKRPTDSMQLGLGANAATKTLTMDVGDGASNPKITVPMATKDFNFNKAVKIANDLLQVGNGTATSNKTIEFNLGLGAANPKMRWNFTDAALEFSNDGLNFAGVGSGSGGGSGIELLSNPGFESGVTSGWVASGLTPALVTSGGSLINGKKTAAITATATGQYYRSTPVDIPVLLRGKACLARTNYLGGSSSWKVQILDGAGTLVTSSNQNVEQQIPFAAIGQSSSLMELSFQCPVSGQLSIQFISTAAAPVMYVDDLHLGSDDRISKIPEQTGLVAAGFWPSTTGCNFSTSSTTPVPLSGVAACVAPSIITNQGPGTVPALDQNGLNFTVQSLPEGTYEVRISARMFSGTAGQAMAITVTDGTTFSPIMFGSMPTTGSGPGSTATGWFTYTGAPTDRTFTLALNSGSATPVGVDNSGGFMAYWSIHRVGGNSRNTILNAQTSGWRVRAQIVGLGDGLTAVAQSELTTANGTAGTIGSGSAAIGQACAGTTPSVVGQMTCAGSRAAGFTTNIPTGGSYKLCVNYTLQIDSSTGGDVIVYNRLHETANNNSATIIQSGAEEGTMRQAINSTTGGSHIQNVNQCEVYNYASAGQKTYRIFRQRQVNSGTANTINYGDFNFTMEKVSENVPMPVFVGPFAQMPTGVITTAGYAISSADAIVDFDTTANAIAATLPTAIGARGKTIILSKKNAGLNAVTVTPVAGQTIAGKSSTILIENPDVIELYSDGSNWQWKSSPNRSLSFFFGGAGTYFSPSNCTSSPCNLYASNGGVSQVNRGSAGSYTPQIVGGTFSNGTECVCSSTRFGVEGGVCSQLDAGVTLITGNRSNVASQTDQIVHVNCSGQR